MAYDDVQLDITESAAGADIYNPASTGVHVDLVPIGNESVPSYNTPQDRNQQAIDSKSLANLYPTQPKTSIAPTLNTKGKVVCFDTETTGVSPLDSKLVVCSFWDLSKGPETMMTFSGWDEEVLINDIAEYLNTETPDTLVAYNMGFDLNFLLTRMMAFGVRCPPLYKMKNFDIMTILGQGGMAWAKPISKVGTAEDWLQYFYGESKPFTIEEILAGYKNNDLVPAIVRNHACVYCEGRLYQLMMQVWGGDISFTKELVPTVMLNTEMTNFAARTVTCPICLTENICQGIGAHQLCVVCHNDLTSLCSGV